MRFCVDIEILEKEYTLTEAVYMLSTVNSRSKFSGIRPTNHTKMLYFLILKINVLTSCGQFNFCGTAESYSIEALTDILINENLYDLAFTVVLKFWKESGMKRWIGTLVDSLFFPCPFYL